MAEDDRPITELSGDQIYAQALAVIALWASAPGSPAIILAINDHLSHLTKADIARVCAASVGCLWALNGPVSREKIHEQMQIFELEAMWRAEP